MPVNYATFFATFYTTYGHRNMQTRHASVTPFESVLQR